MNSPGTILSYSPEDPSVHSRGKTRISPTLVWMAAFTETVSHGLSDPLQDSPLLSDEAAMGWLWFLSFKKVFHWTSTRPPLLLRVLLNRKVTVILLKTLYPQQFWGEISELVLLLSFETSSEVRSVVHCSRPVEGEQAPLLRLIVCFVVGPQCFPCLNHSDKRCQSEVLDLFVPTRGSKSTAICHTAQPK